MISFELLFHIAADLEAYRGNGRELIRFDSRDKGNYSGYGHESLFEMFEENDPTGLSMAMMLNEMIEATIVTSKVDLHRVLREPDYVDHLNEMIRIKDRLDAVLKLPLETLMQKLQNALQAISADYGTPDTREATCCLRDAIYCMHRGLTLRWLHIEDTAPDATIALSNTIGHYTDVAAFTDALRFELPWGAHLARIGHDATCIGIKQPGRVAYLSSLSINIHSGDMRQTLAPDTVHAEKYDLDTAVQRYPDWFQSPYVPNGSSVQLDRRLAEKSKQHSLNHIALLPRDRLIWLAMVVEMAVQRMAATCPADVELAEVAVRALGLDTGAKAKLPAVISPNWKIADIQLSNVLASLEFSEWESKFLSPAIEGLTETHFLPSGEKAMAVNLETRKLSRWKDDLWNSDEQEYSALHARITPAAISVVGTQSEVLTARQQIMRRNLANYLLNWGNRRFMQEWKSLEPRLRELLSKNLPRALASRCATIKEAESTSGFGVTLYNQSHKHKTFRPCCFFNGRKPMTHFANLTASNSQDLVEMLGLNAEAELPHFLQGWSREIGWATSERTAEAPSIERWKFADSGRYVSEWAMLCSAKVIFNAASVPPEYLLQPERNKS